MKVDLHLKNKKALVFGSSMGIGKAIAQSLLNEGASVCISSRSEENIQKCAKEIGTEYTPVSYTHLTLPTIYSV